MALIERPHIRLANAFDIIKKAQAQKYAVPHVNINNLEWTKAVLSAAEESKTPVILGVSEGAAKYMGGFDTVFGMVSGLVEYLQTTVPVVLHLDHGTKEGAFKALEAGFTSVMFDGSHLPFAANKEASLAVLERAREVGASVELETGTIGGEEDGVVGRGELADPAECVELYKLPGVTMLAAGFGNIHGIYPDNWQGLAFDRLEEIAQATNAPLVLHGGSGIPDEQVQRAIALGVCKVNVNTECQLAFAEATRKYIEAGSDLDLHKKGFDPRKLLKPGYEAIKAKCLEKFALFGALNKAI